LERIDAERLAGRLMRKHKLTSKGWILRFNNRRNPLGIAFEHGRKRWIGLSLPFVLSNTPDKVEEVVLHEIAHVLRGVEYGHDQWWRLIARSIGASGRRKHTKSISRMRAIGRWVCGYCSSHSEVSRRPKSGVRYACRQCLDKHGDTKANQSRFAMKLFYYAGEK
jgi:predicted SprT family Zn-dependent metalloprotease